MMCAVVVVVGVVVAAVAAIVVAVVAAVAAVSVVVAAVVAALAAFFSANRFFSEDLISYLINQLLSTRSGQLIESTLFQEEEEESCLLTQLEPLNKSIKRSFSYLFFFHSFIITLTVTPFESPWNS